MSELSPVAIAALPVLDLEPFWHGDPQQQQAVADRLYFACRDVGFVYLVNHGISQALIDRMFAASEAFFALPADLKHRLTSFAPIDPQFRGLYLGVGEEVLDPDNPIADLKEAFDLFHVDCYLNRWVQVEKPASDAAPISLEQTGQTEFAQTALAFFAACNAASQQILRVFARALHLPESFFVDRFGHNSDLRVNYYPAIESPPPVGQKRFSAHTDYGGITLLFQRDVGGLEIQSAGGDWIAAPPAPGAIGINLGDLMQQWTNDVFRSTPHRVLMPSDQSDRRSRYSLTFFVEPNPGVEVACLPSCQSIDRPARYAPIQAETYLVGRVQDALTATNGG